MPNRRVMTVRLRYNAEQRTWWTTIWGYRNGLCYWQQAARIPLEEQ